MPLRESKEFQVVKEPASCCIENILASRASRLRLCHSGLRSSLQRTRARVTHSTLILQNTGILVAQRQPWKGKPKMGHNK